MSHSFGIQAQRECFPTLPWPIFKDFSFFMTGDVLSLLASCFRHFCRTIEDSRHPRMPLLAQSSRVLTLPLRWKSPKSRGGSRNFFIGGSKLWFRKDWTFLWLITSSPYHPPPPPPHPLPPVVVASLALTVYLHSTRKGCTLRASSSCASSNKNCTDFVNIIGGYPKTITFLNIPGIWLTGKMQSAFHWKKSAS